ncbi:MAG TPA: AMP-binding protein, partial [Longimicrobiales bacterium]|nr:AMP-binding protein [Longimicrobiales bacterium]
IPAVPASAFKHLRLVSGDPASAETVFRTSGTSRGVGRRGEHAILDTELYKASLLPSFRAHLLPDGARPAVLSLVPSPRESPDSSLSWMMGAVVEALGGEGSGWFVDPATGIREEALSDALRDAEAAGGPVLVAGTGFALVHWVDAMDRRGWRVRLPPGSRIMETGGFKGRSRSLEKASFYRALHERLGVPPERIVNEYGMTELLSQFYEPVLREGEAAGGPASRRHVGPPWVRTRVLDPRTLQAVPPGKPGILCHLDLANVGSVAHVLTADRGIGVAGGFRVLGRIEGAEPRGCSLAMDELLEAAGG